MKASSQKYSSVSSSYNSARVLLPDLAQQRQAQRIVNVLQGKRVETKAKNSLHCVLEFQPGNS